MIKKITNTVLGNHIENLENDSQNILDVFTKTVTGLEAVNAKADTHIGLKEKAKLKLENDLVKLAAIKENNGKVIAKIGKIFE